MCDLAEPDAAANGDNDSIARQKRMDELLATSPVLEVLGVVSPSGASGGYHGDNLGTLLLTFVTWRIVGGGLESEPLRICRETPAEELRGWMSKFKPYAVVRIKAGIGESVYNGPQALLEEFVGVDSSDAELNHHADELQKPVTFEDPTFGTFTLNRQVD